MNNNIGAQKQNMSLADSKPISYVNVNPNQLQFHQNGYNPSLTDTNVPTLANSNTAENSYNYHTNFLSYQFPSNVYNSNTASYLTNNNAHLNLDSPIQNYNSYFPNSQLPQITTNENSNPLIN
jgi:hypothetical protein